MRIGVLTGGGDAQGLNAAIRAIVRKAAREGYEVWGIQSGWLGLIDGKLDPLTLEAVSGILPRGGTILGTSRTNPLATEDGLKRVFENMKKFALDVLIAIGGDDTLSVALELSRKGLKVVGIPKTIDNDVWGTDYTIGFHTAASVVADALDKLHPTAEAHNRVMVVEVMGRDAGWVATVGGLAGGADLILIPEVPFTIAQICERIRARHGRGKTFSIVVVAEGAKPADLPTPVVQESTLDAFGHVRLGGIGHVLAREIEKQTGYEVRVTVLGHLQRGGPPTLFDRILATRMGVAAVELIKNRMFGLMVGLQGDKIVPLPLEEALAQMKKVDRELYEIAALFN